MADKEGSLKCQAAKLVDLPLHESQCEVLHIDSDGSLMLTLGAQGRLAASNPSAALASSSALQPPLWRHRLVQIGSDTKITAAAVSSDRSFLAYGQESETETGIWTRELDPKTGFPKQESPRLLCRTILSVTKLQWHATFPLLGAATEEGKLLVWDYSAGGTGRDRRREFDACNNGADGGVRSIAFDPLGDFVAACYGGGRFVVYGLQDSTTRHKSALWPKAMRGADRLSMGWHPEGSLIVLPGFTKLRVVPRREFQEPVDAAGPSKYLCKGVLPDVHKQNSQMATWTTSNMLLSASGDCIAIWLAHPAALAADASGEELESHITLLKTLSLESAATSLVAHATFGALAGLESGAWTKIDCPFAEAQTLLDKGQKGDQEAKDDDTETQGKDAKPAEDQTQESKGEEKEEDEVEQVIQQPTFQPGATGSSGWWRGFREMQRSFSQEMQGLSLDGDLFPSETQPQSQSQSQQNGFFKRSASQSSLKFGRSDSQSQVDLFPESAGAAAASDSAAAVSIASAEQAQRAARLKPVHRVCYLSWNGHGTLKYFPTASTAGQVSVLYTRERGRSAVKEHAAPVGLALGSVGPGLLALAANPTSKNGNIKPRVHVYIASPWTKASYEHALPNNETIEALAVGRAFIAVYTEPNRCLKLFSIAGIHIACLAQADPVVAMVATEDLLLVVNKQPQQQQQQQAEDSLEPALTYSLYGVLAKERLAQGTLPLSPKTSLRWLGFSAECTPLTMDSHGVIRALVYSGQAAVHSGHIAGQWVPVAEIPVQRPVQQLKRRQQQQQQQQPRESEAASAPASNLELFPISAENGTLICAEARAGEEPSVSNSVKIRHVKLRMPLFPSAATAASGGSSDSIEDSEEAWFRGGIAESCDTLLRHSFWASQLDFACQTKLLAPPLQKAMEKGRAKRQEKVAESKQLLQLFELLASKNDAHRALDLLHSILPNFGLEKTQEQSLLRQAAQAALAVGRPNLQSRVMEWRTERAIGRLRQSESQAQKGAANATGAAAEVEDEVEEDDLEDEGEGEEEEEEQDEGVEEAPEDADKENVAQDSVHGLRRALPGAEGDLPAQKMMRVQ